MIDTKTVKRGDLYYVDLGDGIGSEQCGLRPAVIVQNDKGNRFSTTVIVAPLTSKAKKLMPTHVTLENNEDLPKTSTVLLEQVRIVDKQRLKEKIGHVTKKELIKINKCLEISLGIKRN